MRRNLQPGGLLCLLLMGLGLLVQACGSADVYAANSTASITQTQPAKPTPYSYNHDYATTLDTLLKQLRQLELADSPLALVYRKLAPVIAEVDKFRGKTLPKGGLPGLRNPVEAACWVGGKILVLDIVCVTEPLVKTIGSRAQALHTQLSPVVTSLAAYSNLYKQGCVSQGQTDDLTNLLISLKTEFSTLDNEVSDLEALLTYTQKHQISFQSVILTVTDFLALKEYKNTIENRNKNVAAAIKVLDNIKQTTAC